MKGLVKKTDGVCAGRFFFFLFFSVALVSVLRGHSVFSSPPQRPITSDGTFLIQHLFLCASFQPLFSRRKGAIYYASELDKLLKYKTSSSSYHTALHKSLQLEHVPKFLSLRLCISPVNQSVISEAMYTWRCWSRTRINHLTENCGIPDGKTLTSGYL